MFANLEEKNFSFSSLVWPMKRLQGWGLNKLLQILSLLLCDIMPLSPGPGHTGTVTTYTLLWRLTPGQASRKLTQNSLARFEEKMSGNLNHQATGCAENFADNPWMSWSANWIYTRWDSWLEYTMACLDHLLCLGLVSFLVLRWPALPQCPNKT